MRIAPFSLNKNKWWHPHHVENGQEVGSGTKCEELRLSKSSPLCRDERTSVRSNAASEMGQIKLMRRGNSPDDQPVDTRAHGLFWQTRFSKAVNNNL